MAFKMLGAATAALSMTLATVPAAAAPAAKLSLSEAPRASTEVEGEKLAGGGSTALIFFAGVAAVIAGVLIADDDDDPDSP